MPLPPALAAKLAKRGIISAPKVAEPEAAATGPEEEIIAEDYDEAPPLLETQTNLDAFDPYMGYNGCPNKWNVYHECTHQCKELWKVVKDINPETDKRRQKMLLKYPLPNHWMEILDSGIGRYYYWNTETDLVSWLPPGHPKCQVSLAAAILRKQLIADRKIREIEETEKVKTRDSKKRPAESSDEDISDHSRDSESETDDSDDEMKPPPPDKLKKLPEKTRYQLEKESRARRKPKDDLDPMDPASYGECPRGSWSDGLPTQNEARTGVDTTANGPLFQMRPYPSPGSILRANAANGGGVGPKKPT